MGNKRQSVVLAGLLGFGSCVASVTGVDAGPDEALGPRAPEDPPGEMVESGAEALADTDCRIAEATLVEIEIVDPVSSSTATRGGRFRIVLAEPLLVGGRVVVPVGADGYGEVVHADRSRGGGKPGELLLAARELAHGDQRLGLRGMKVGGSGADRTQAALATSIAVGPFAHFVRGREIEIPAGTRAQARLSASVPCPNAPEGMQGEPDPGAAAGDGDAIDDAGPPDNASPTQQ